MRIDTKKYLFVGMEEQRNHFFEQAQEAGFIHFIDSKSSTSKEVPEEVHDLHAAIKVLRGMPPVEQEEMDDYSEARPLVKEILALKETFDKQEELERITKLEISRVDIFGPFSLEDKRFIEEKSGRKMQFFCAKKGFHEEAPKEALFVGSDHGLDYFVTLNPEKSFYDGMIEMQVDEPVQVLEEKLGKIRQKKQVAEEGLKKYPKYNEFLHNALIVKLNDYHLATAETFPTEALEGSLFAVEGWVPKDKVEQLKRFNVHTEEIAVAEDDVAPTCLENEGLQRIGEDLVHIYDTPSNTDKDPSLWVLIFFAIFFGIIVGDGGYGFIYFLIGAFIALKSKKITKGGRRLLTLVGILCASTIIWGVMINSFFGINFAPDSPVRKVSFLQWLVNKKADYHLSAKDEIYDEWLVKFPEVGAANSYTEFLSKGVSVKDGKESYDILNKFSDNIMMELALLIGVIHTCLSLARYIGRSWANFGWILAIIGAYLYIPVYLDASSMVHFVFGVSPEMAAWEGKYLMGVGFGLACLLSLIQNRLWGIMEPMNVIQIFSDILSYLRLYALGLASGIVSVTINEFAASAGAFFGIILLIIGHGANMLLGVMGGVIHGLRLNFLEWYHYSFEGGGKIFSPLEKIEIE
jgi:V/A-type H+-transporting ATPase subunit I